jgi:hypothetical protein
MHAHLRRGAVALAFCIVGALAWSGSAFAASSDGATHYILPEMCTTTDYGTYCQSQDVVFNVTRTPSGQYSFAANGTTSQSFAGPGCSVSSETAIHQHYLLFGPNSELSDRWRTSLDVGCSGITEQCSTSQFFHIANGEMQFFRYENNCTPL